MKSYSSFIKENIETIQKVNEDTSQPIAFTFGRFNPPTRGHGHLFDTLKASASQYFIFTSQSQDKKKNPLSYSQKIKYARAMFPEHGRAIIEDMTVRTIFDALVRLYDRGFKKIILVVGDDRVRELETLINKYNGVEAGHGYYNFAPEHIEVRSSGARDPDAADDVSGVSASRARKTVLENDFQEFQKMIPPNFDEAIKLFKDLRRAMGINEFFSPKFNIEPSPEIHESFDTGQLVRVKDTKIEETIHFVGPNYLILNNGKRFWKSDVEIV